MPNRLLNALLRGLSGSPRETAAGPAAPSSPSKQTPAAKPYVRGELPPDEMEQQLARLLGETNCLNRGQLILLDAKNLVDKFGKQWPSLAERAEEIICQSIEKEQRPGDGYTRLEGLTYLLMYPTKGPGLGEAAAVRIVLDIAERLVGASWTADLFILRTVFGCLPDALEV